MEYPFVGLFLASLGATLAAMPLARYLGMRAGLLDHPHERKIHSTPVPRTGGVAILVGLTVGTVFLLKLSGPLGLPVTRELLAVVAGGVVIHLLGVLDDLLDLPAGGKLAAQTVAVGVVVSQGVVLERLVFPGGPAWELGVFAMPLTAFFLLGLVNAINLVDGLDGLAGGIAAIGALSLAVAGLAGGNYVLAALATILLGSVCGFLPYNFVGKKVFLGDSGSMLLGYLLGVTAIRGARFAGESTAVFVVLAAASIPVLDTATTIVRRFRAGRKLFRADSMHIHHRLVRSGLSPRRTVLTILAVTLFAAGQTLVFFVEGMRPLVISTSLAGLLAGLQIRHRRRRDLPVTDSGFRDVLFYLLGAQEGRDPATAGELTLIDVITGAAAAEAGAGTGMAEATAGAGGNGDGPRPEVGVTAGPGEVPVGAGPRAVRGEDVSV